MTKGALLRIPLAVVLLAVQLSCGGDSSTNADPNAICTDAVNVTVSAGASPVISWSPSCKVVFLTVEDFQNGDTQWAVSAQTGFSSPVTYGVVPPGATQSAPANALVSGTNYNVMLFKNLSIAGVIGQRPFTR
jgi:hypothetical protein